MVVVTTPQEVSLLDITKSINFAEVTNTPVIGIVENMSGFVCPHCGETTNIFKKDGGKNIAEQLSIEFLGAVPLIPAICVAGDVGKPAVLVDEDSESIFLEITEKIEKILNTKDS